MEMTKDEANQLRHALSWVRAALNCKSWEWDSDQRQCAEGDLKDALFIIDNYHDPEQLGYETFNSAEEDGDMGGLE